MRIYADDAPSTPVGSGLDNIKVCRVMLELQAYFLS